MFVKNNIIRNKVANIAWKIFNKFENNGYSDFEVNGERYFLENLCKYFESLKKEEIVFFDVGANIGDYTKVFLDYSNKYKIKTRLHLFEPTEACYKELFNKYQENFIKLNNFGISNEICNAKIFYNEEKSGLASLYQRNLMHYDINMNESEEIKLIRADKYIEECQLKHIDFIKIDIEGHELKAFEGFGKYLNFDFIDFIQFEYGGANLDSHTSLLEIYTFLEEKGFFIFKIMQDGLQERKYKPFMENFMNSNYVAISKNIKNKI